MYSVEEFINIAWINKYLSVDANSLFSDFSLRKLMSTLLKALGLILIG